MIWYMIAGMCVVTFVPRVIPLLLGRELALPRWVRRWLSYFPYAALGSLISPWWKASPGSGSSPGCARRCLR